MAGELIASASFLPGASGKHDSGTLIGATSVVAVGNCVSVGYSNLAVHHPSRELIADFATGELALGPALAVRLHVEVCPGCQGAVAAIEEAEGRLLASLPGVTMSPSALHDALAMLDAEQEPAPHAPTIEGLRLPEAVERIGLSPPVYLAPETWVAHLDAPRIEGWRTYVFCGPAGTALPRHGHSGDELIVVLEGKFDDGREFSAGDFAENKANFVHHMQVSGDGRCVALISAAGAIEWSPGDRSLGALLDI